MDKKDLLDEITKLAGCGFISELRDPGRETQIREALEHIEEESYTLKEWTDAAVYLCRKDVSPATVQEARVMISRYKK